MNFARKLALLSPRALAWAVFGSIVGGALVTVGYLDVIAVGHKQAEMRRHVRDLAVAAAGMVDVTSHELLTERAQLDSAEYHQALAPLIRFHRRHPSIQYLWTVRVSPDGGQTFVLETSVDDEIRRRQTALGRTQDILAFLGPNTAETPAGAASLAALRGGTELVFPLPYSDAHGTYIEARAPLQDNAGRFIGYLGVDYALESYDQQVNEVRLAGGIALGLALALGMLLARAAYHMRKQSLAYLAAAEEQRDLAAKADAAKSELLRIASHDLKNPLAAIAGMSGLLEKMMRKRPDQAAVGPDLEVITTIHGAARQMSEILRGILTNEGIEHGGLPFRPVPTDLGRLVNEVLEFNSTHARRKGVSLHRELAPGVTATVDATLLREAFDNYVSNAVKYSSPGKSVTVSLRRAAEGAEFAVQDEGPGLSAADQGRLFQKFTKLTPGRPAASLPPASASRSSRR